MHGRLLGQGWSGLGYHLLCGPGRHLCYCGGVASATTTAAAGVSPTAGSGLGRLLQLVRVRMLNLKGLLLCGGTARVLLLVDYTERDRD